MCCFFFVFFRELADLHHVVWIDTGHVLFATVLTKDNFHSRI